MAALQSGGVVSIDKIAGRWSVWSQIDEAPCAHVFLPVDDAARSSGFKYVVAIARHAKNASRPTITFLRGEKA